MNPLITIEHLCAGYEGKEILHDICLTISEKDFLGIIGPNGGGKTTLIRCLLGLLKPFSGTITYHKKAMQVGNALPIGYLPQYQMFDKRFPITVQEVVLSGFCGALKMGKAFSQEQKDRAFYEIEKMGLKGYESFSLNQLSGGEMQRVLLARALVSSPHLLILDEPSTYLDAHSQSRLYELLQEINKDCAIVLVSHDVGSVLRSVKNIACVNRDLHYHPAESVDSAWLQGNLGCPIDLLGHGKFPHRVVEEHED